MTHIADHFASYLAHPSQQPVDQAYLDRYWGGDRERYEAARREFTDELIVERGEES